MFAAVSRIAIAFTALWVSYLSEEDVSREQLKNDKVPIRVTITPEKSEYVRIEFALIHDHPARRYDEDIRARMLLDLNHPTLGKIRTSVETRKDTDAQDKIATVGYIRLTPDIAKNCRAEIYVGPTRLDALIEHRYMIPLSIFADELRSK
jgi:hypothetical protein